MDDVCPKCGKSGIYFDAGLGCYYCPNCNSKIGKSYYKVPIIINYNLYKKQLRHELTEYWSRRIDSANRLVYKVDDNKLYIVQCGTHYHQKK